jgi:DNA (cytosine-5)-methyltransferase 1
MARTSSKYTTVESFCGAGGLSLGLSQTGFDVVSAFDIDEKSVETYNLNIGNRAFVADALKVRGSGLLQRGKIKKLDLFSGGPPCQGFSKQRRGAYLLKDERNKLVIEYARLVNETSPRAFFLENVSSLGQKRGKYFLEVARELLGEYTITANFYNSADYGLAQTRERYITVGIRKDIEAVFHPPTPTVKTWVTVRDAIGDLPEPPVDCSIHPDFPNHQAAHVSPINVERFSYVPPGGGWQSIPDDLKLECHKRVDTTSGGWPDTYGRLEWDKQCPTITGGFDSFSRGRYGHPKYHRPLTPREAARFQGFPDSFVFCGTRGDVRRQIGNAVPPALAKAIGKSIKRVLMIEDGFLRGGKADFDFQQRIAAYA